MVHTVGRAAWAVPPRSDHTVAFLIFTAIIVVFINIHLANRWLMRLPAFFFRSLRDLPVLRLLRLGVVYGRE